MTHEIDQERAYRARLFELTTKLRRSPFGRQKDLLDLCDMAEQIANKLVLRVATVGQEPVDVVTDAGQPAPAADCPVCAHRRAVENARVQRHRRNKRAAKRGE